MRKIVKIISNLLVITIIAASFTAFPTAYADGQGDITVTMVTPAASTIYDMDDVKFSSVIRNVGSEAITENFDIKFYVDGTEFDTVTCTADIASNGMTVVQTTQSFNSYFGTHKITASANFSKIVSETDFTNNTLKSRFVVLDEENPMNIVNAIPKNPTKISEPVKIKSDASVATVLGESNINTENKGYTGDGYVEYITRNGDGVEFTVNAEETASYFIKIRYANGSENPSTCGVIVNNKENQFSFPGQKYWDSWDYYTFSEELNQGENKIKIIKRSDSDNGNINVDSIEISRIYTKRFNDFAFLKENNPTLDSDIICDITDTGLIYAYVPSNIDLTKLVASYTCTMNSVKVLGKEQTSGITINDFTNGHYYTVSDGTTERVFTVLLYKLKDTKMPNVFVEFGDDVSANDKQNVVFGADKTLKVPCAFTVKTGKNSSIINAEEMEFTELDHQVATINLRGNSTLHQPKKSWKVKLEEKSKVLDMPKSKHWILLASYDDKSMLRQYTGYELARNAFNSCGYSAPRARYCNLFVDGKYNGVYFIMEQLRLANEKRVNADSMEDFYLTDTTNLTGGYLLELDSRQANYQGDEDPALVFQAGSYWFVFKDPDETVITSQMTQYMKNYINDFVNALTENPASGNYKQYIDVDSFVDWYLTMEIMKNLDAAGNTSIYCYKVRDGKLYMGPCWDFDISSGNVNYNDGCMVPDGWYMKDSFWYKSLMKDPYFTSKVKERYAQFRNGSYDLLTSVKSADTYIKDGMSDNFKKWDYLNSYFWPEPDVLHTHDSYALQLEDWLEARLEWLDDNINNL